MSSTPSTIRVKGLAPRELAALRKQAKALGISTEAYAKDLIETGVSLVQLARGKTLDELYAPIQARFSRNEVTADELDGLVDAARTRHHRRTSRKRN
jgi:hypothetical protein